MKDGFIKLDSRNLTKPRLTHKAAKNSDNYKLDSPHICHGEASSEGCM